MKHMLLVMQKELPGLTVEEASALFPDYSFRVTRNNGNACICTQDYKIDRVNVHIRDKIITEVAHFG
jgi:hypothetical protein